MSHGDDRDFSARPWSSAIPQRTASRTFAARFVADVALAKAGVSEAVNESGVPEQPAKTRPI